MGKHFYSTTNIQAKLQIAASSLNFAKEACHASPQEERDGQIHFGKTGRDPQIMINPNQLWEVQAYLYHKPMMKITSTPDRISSLSIKAAAMV